MRGRGGLLWGLAGSYPEGLLRRLGLGPLEAGVMFRYTEEGAGRETEAGRRGVSV